ncbi:MAG: ThuA domain-containing protein [Oscillospiraceae bacterium]|nr:ThuA domain-containing protein [Oscillospiraceae bacterium]MDD4367645.1 ThuA domain-containing protein [Oscillospiraceae bacterium]
MNRKINVTIYNENFHEQTMPEVRAIYPQGIHHAVAAALPAQQVGQIRFATLDDHESTLSQEILDDTDVLIWWGHAKHEEVSDAVVERCALRVLHGMGLIVLHSGHASKLMRRLLGTETHLLRWREAGERARLWTVQPGHPIAQGLPETFVVPSDETYGEPFGIPQPDELVFLTWFQGGEVFRSGCTWQRGAGKIFYLQNGHETYPVYWQPEIRRIISNAVLWACPAERQVTADRGPGNVPPLEPAD